MAEFISLLFQQDDEDGDNEQLDDYDNDCQFRAFKSSVQMPPKPRSKYDLVGLENQGATCYMNSLIQTYYMLPEFRKAVFSIKPQAVSYNDVEKWIHSNDSEMVKTYTKMKEANKKIRARMIPLLLQQLFAELRFLDRSAVSTERLTTVGFQWSGANKNHASIQHDVQDLNINLLDWISRSLEGTDCTDLTGRLFGGLQCDELKCHKCKNVRSKNSSFYDLRVPIKGFRDLAQSFAEMSRPEQMDQDNAVMCEACGDKQPTEKRWWLPKLPPVLIVSLNRFAFNFHTLKREKVVTKFEIPLVLDMSYFQDARGPWTEHRRQRLQNEGMIWLSELRTKESEAKAFKRLHALMKDRDAVVYDLFSVIIHAGSAHGGHYHAYIRDVEGLGKWESPSTTFSQADDATLSADVISKCKDDPEALLIAILAVQPQQTASFSELGSLVHRNTGKRWREYCPGQGIRPFCQACGKFAVEKASVTLAPTSAATQKSSAPPSKPKTSADAGQWITVGAKKKSSSKSMDEYERIITKILSSQKNNTAAFNQLGSLIKLNTGKKWSNLHKGGVSLSRFCRNSDMFVVDQTSVSLAKKSVKHASTTSASPSANKRGWETVNSVPKPTPKSSESPDSEFLASRWGRWFDFNDSRVKPIHVQDIRSLFEGRESAYMLIYRSRALSVSPGARTGATSSSTSASAVPVDYTTETLPQRVKSLRFHGVKCPDVWCKQVDSQNQNLKNAWTVYNTISNQINVRISCPSSFSISDDGLILSRVSAPEASTEADSIVSAEFRIDVRKGWEPVLAEIHSKFGPADPSIATTQPSELWLHMLRTANPKAKDQGLYIAKPVQYPGRDAESGSASTMPVDPATLFAGLTDGDHLLAWCGPQPTVTKTGFRVMPIVGTEESDAPVSLQILVLSHEGAPQKHQVFARKSQTLIELRLRLASLLDVEIDAFYLFLVVIRNNCSSVKALEKNFYLNDKPLQEWGIGDQSELIVEMPKKLPEEQPPKKGKPPKATLAHQEMQRRRKITHVTIVNVTDGTPSDPEPPQVEFTVTKDSQLLEVKLIACGHLGLPATAVNTLRLRHTNGCGVGAALVERESQQIDACLSATAQSSKFLLETGEPLKESEIELHVGTIVGNDPSSETVKGGVIQRNTKSLVIAKKATLEELKRLIFSTAPEIPVAVTNDAEFQSRHRLRAGTSNGDCGRLLRPKKKNEVAEVLNHGQIVWLEEGSLPRQNVIKTKMILWSPPAQRVEASSFSPTKMISGMLSSLIDTVAGSIGAAEGGANETVAVKTESNDSKSDNETGKPASDANKQTTIAEDAITRLDRLGKACLLPIGMLDDESEGPLPPLCELDESTTLKEIKEMLLSRSKLVQMASDGYCGAAVQALATKSKLTLKHLRVRLLGKHHTPTFVWCNDRHCATIKHVANRNKRQKLQVVALVVELLPEPVEPQPGALLLWVQHHELPDNNPSWPPICVTLRASSPNLEDLRQCILPVTGLEAKDAKGLVMAKFNGSHGWTRLKQIKARKRGKKKNKGPKSVVQQYGLRDGSLISWCSSTECGADTDFRRASDLMWKNLETGKGGDTSRSKGGGGKNKRRVEHNIAAPILNFDHNDSDEADDSAFVSPVEPEFQYQEQLGTLTAMGFTQLDKCKEVLIKTSGDVIAAIEQLV